MDLTHIEASVLEMVKHDHTLTLLNGELIDRYLCMQYLLTSCEDNNNNYECLSDLVRICISLFIILLHFA